MKKEAADLNIIQIDSSLFSMRLPYPLELQYLKS